MVIKTNQRNSEFIKSILNWTDGPAIISYGSGDINLINELHLHLHHLDSKSRLNTNGRNTNRQHEQTQLIFIETGKRVDIDVVIGDETISSCYVGYERGEITKHQVKAEVGQTVILACLFQDGTRHVTTISSNKTIEQTFLEENDSFTVKYGADHQYKVTPAFEPVKFTYKGRQIEIYGRSAREERLFGDAVSIADILLKNTMHTRGFTFALLRSFDLLFGLQTRLGPAN